MTDTFRAAMRLMRKRDPQGQEDGFHTLLPVASDVLPQLVEEYRAEPDPGLRRWLLELIGEARSTDALPILAQELGSEDESIRDWARRGLEKLDTKEARTLLWQDGQNRND
ncbi:HEAT repeat domain-containing protein [Nocardioides sp. MH1]|uniref:HEAT repeat domain-containing protein n=1 Tax=Nocardioides sp. MH1 TaxID=3242490 RepID=UPI003520C727